jgi:hypothetical protein
VMPTVFESSICSAMTFYGLDLLKVCCSCTVSMNQSVDSITDERMGSNVC